MDFSGRKWIMAFELGYIGVKRAEIKKAPFGADACDAYER
jgi:hypothetical protein